MNKLLSFVTRYRLSVGLALALMMFELVAELVLPLFLAKMIDEGIVAQDLSVVLKWGGLMLGLSCLSFIAGIANSFYAAHVSQNTGYDLRNFLYRKSQFLSAEQAHAFSSSSLITLLTNDVLQIQTTIFMSLRIMLRAPLLIIGGVVMALLVNSRVALILLICIPLLVFFLVWMLKKGARLFSQVQMRLDRVNHSIYENLAGMKLIKAFVRSSHEEKRFSTRNEALMTDTIRALRLMEMTMPLLLLVMNSAILLILWFGTVHIQTGGAQIGEVVAIVNYATRIASALHVFSMIILAFSRARASAGRLVELLDVEVDVERNSSSSPPVTRALPIQCKEIGFRYPAASCNALTEITADIKAGETIAILGATGSGKTSFLQLIPRLHDATAGEIIIGGRHIREWNLKDLRMTIGYVPQDVTLFSRTIKENITWGKQAATMDEVHAAAEAAQLVETIAAMPDGYETVVAQRGVSLSGGQKQRISIARALIRRPSILLLDDSTSALDTKTEAALLHALASYSCTTLLVTQKVSTARQADQIWILEDGQLIETGTHDQLYEASSYYQRLYQSQTKGDAFGHVQSLY
ncbi:ABC transporter ATP-binding protein/permease [Alkalihalobacillus oceani]|uniref:ABC transporter ATP-binding protein/permease n=1 Tax=Halalkalibacter oceani TaxID=1653776 RepID=A0A9X2IPS5_9BACI|nr:ABC transporter ATP-binding protein [Halalkalibacter oceani]MCM3713873.1 ABC transporter ATP-binding protein/permease [Halalkalibacter oceani]